MMFSMARPARWLAFAWLLSPFPLAVAAGSPDLATAAELVIDLTNEFRAQERLAKLAPNAQLNEAARAFADFMARTGKYGHAADGSQPAERAKRHGYDACIVAENIAYLYSSTGFTTQALAQGFTQGWMDSPSHRKNMLDADVTESAVAIAQARESGHYYAVQLFGRQGSEAVRFEITNRSTALVQYRLRERAFSLPPRHTRTHRECRRASVTFQLQVEESVQPQNGERYAIVPDSAGRLALRRE
jgi:uncharacterized protein YkwD